MPSLQPCRRHPCRPARSQETASAFGNRRERYVKFGIFTMNAHSCSRPATAVAVAQAAEACGFESLWCGEHVVMTEPPTGDEPLGPRDPILDPLIALAHFAGTTMTIRLATGIVILPLRNPLVLAKQLASIDVLSNGRLMFGYGVGWLEPVFNAVGVPFGDRGPRAVSAWESPAIGRGGSGCLKYRSRF